MVAKPRLTIRTTLLTIIGTLNVMIAALIANSLYISWNNYQNASLLNDASYIINALHDTNQYLSLERGATMSILYASPEEIVPLHEELQRYRKNTDEALHAALNMLPDDLDDALANQLAEIRSGTIQLQDLRQDLDIALTQTRDERDKGLAMRTFTLATSLVEQIQHFTLLYSLPYQWTDAAINQQMRFKYFVWDLAEYAGQEYALIGKLIGEDKAPDAAQEELLMNLRWRIQYGWEILREFSLSDVLAGELLPMIEEAETHYSMTFDQVRDMMAGFHAAPETASWPISTEMWIGLASQAVDSLLGLQDEVLKETRAYVETMGMAAQRKIILHSIIFLCALILSLYCWSIVVFRVTRPVNAMVNALYKATQNESYEMPKILHHQDEIGKLVRVLEVFQDNANKIRQSNEELERFAYIAAHDLKSPLRAVDNLSQWLEEDLNPFLQDENRDHMNELRKRVRLMDKLLDDTLEYARIGSKIESGPSVMINGAILIDEIKALLNVPPAFTITASERMAHTTLPKLPLQQVLHNLISNGVKHHDRDDGHIHVDLEETHSDYIFTVRDDGPGIAPQYHQKIFEMFQTLTHDKSKGRGMGLAMVRKIIMTHGGGITISSEPGKGAAFRFTWPKEGAIQRTKDDDNERLYA